MVLAWHVTIAPTWFDPSTAPPQITPFGMLYAIHDALVRPLPGQKMAPSLAESWKESPDGLTYEFKLRRGLKFHNGDPVTAEDAKFSYERYKGAGAKELQARIQSVEVVDPLTIRFRLKEPWPDFMTFYGTTATAAGLVVPKKYVTQVGDEGFRKHPIGAGPYKFVSHQPGVEVVLEAYPGYWRHVPYVKRLVMKSVPETTSRVAMLKNGEADIAYALDGEDALNVKRDPRLQLVPSKHASIYWIEFPEQWDPKSPWHDKRLRLAVNYAARPQGHQRGRLPRLLPAHQRHRAPGDGLRHADRAGALRSRRRPGSSWPRPAIPRASTPATSRPFRPFFAVAEAALNFMNAVGIRTKMRPMERAAFYAAWREKKLRNLFLTAAGNSGNAASRVEAFIASTGAYAYGGYPDIDDLFQQQARERDVGEARGHPPAHPAADHRPGDVRAHHGLPHPARRGTAPRRAHARQHAPGALPGLRGHAAQGSVARRRRSAPGEPPGRGRRLKAGAGAAARPPPRGWRCGRGAPPRTPPRRPP